MLVINYQLYKTTTIYLKLILIENYMIFYLKSAMDLNDLIESNPTAFRVIAVIGGLAIGSIIFILQS